MTQKVTPDAGGPVVAIVPADLPIVKGEILVGNGITTVKMPPGANGEVLTADSTQANGLKYAPAGGAVSEATLSVHGIIGTGKTNPSFAGTRQIAVVPNMGRKYADYAPQGVTGARSPSTNWLIGMAVGATVMGISGSFGDKLYEVASGLNSSWLWSAPITAGWAAFFGLRNKNPYMSRWMYWPAAADIVNARVWYGMFQFDPTLTDTPGANTIAVLFSDGVNGNRWAIHAVDGAGTPTVTDTGIPVVDSVEYFIEIFHDEPNARWQVFINGIQFLVADATGPGSAVAMNFVGTIRRNKSGANVAGVGCGGDYYEQS